MMADPFTQSILCPVLIGRDPQVAALTHLLDQARAGQGQIVLISGEAGIGKSRLVNETSAQAMQQGFRIWKGDCFETDRTLPYALLFDLLHSQPDEENLLDALRDWLIGRRTGSTVDTEETKHYWFEVFAKLLVTAQPQLLICEDLHWADDLSLEFLGFLARQIRQQPLLLLLTYRPDETTDALTRLLALIERQRLAIEMTLRPLDEQETDLMVRTLFQQTTPIRSEFLYTVHSLSEGNPFFVEEILKSLVTTGDIYQAGGAWTRKPLSQLRIPRTIQAAVHSRVAGLRPAAHRLLRLAAVAGRQFDFGILQQITGMDEVTQVDLIKELIDAQLVVEKTVDSFAFRHALTRQSIYNELLQRERSALHQIIGEALEQLHPIPTSVQIANLAYHFYEARLWAKARLYAQQAGEQAQQLDAPRAAIVHFSHAIEASTQLESGQISYTLLYARAQAAERIGEFENARTDYETALAAARLAQDTHGEWQAMLALGFLWTARSYQQADDYFQAALGLARQAGDPIALARTLNRVGNWYLNADEPQTALVYHRKALAFLQQADNLPGAAETLDLLGTATYYSGDLSGAAAYYQAAIDLCRTLDQRTTLVSALLLFAVTGSPNYLHDTLVWSSPNLDAATAASGEALALCQAMQWRPRESFVLTYLAWRAGALGNYGQAFAYAQRALITADESEFHQVAAQLALALLHLDVGSIEQAVYSIEEAQRLTAQVGARMIRRFVDASQARILIAQRRYAQAETLLQQACPPETPMQTPPQRLLWVAWVEWWLATGQPASAFAAVERLSAAQQGPDHGGAMPLLHWLAGEALLALRRFDDAEEILQKARAVAVDHGALPVLWRIESSLARLYRSQRRSTDAEQMTAAVHATRQQLASQLPDEALRQTLQHLVDARLPNAKTPTPRQSTKQAYAGLTSREREVAALVAQGKSNLQIAHDLTLTERTIESHVSNILVKLNFVNRSQIAAWATSKGLT